MTGKIVSRTGWILVHPRKPPQWAAIQFQEDRPDGLIVRFSPWRWQRCIIRLDEADNPVIAEEGQRS